MGNKQTDFANQGDTISRQAAIDALDGNVIVTSRESAQAVMDYIRGCAERIRSLPSAQPEIIRCEDCEFWTHIKRTKRHWCKTDDGLYGLNTFADDFCSRARRRTDD